MKRMFLGGLLFVCGFIGIMALVCISIFKPWNYNGIVGFTGFLLGSGTRGFFNICCILSVVGFVLCTFEAYWRKQK